MRRIECWFLVTVAVALAAGCSSPALTNANSRTDGGPDESNASSDAASAGEASAPAPDGGDAGSPKAAAVYAGGGGACAVLVNGSVECWGLATNGFGGSQSYGPTVITGLTSVKMMAANEATCALLMDGTVSCWGHESAVPGITGGPTTTALATVPDLAGSTSISMGADSMCALTTDGSVLCTSGYAPESAMEGGVSVSTAVAVAAGSLNSCALLSDGTVEAWGSEAWLDPNEVTTTVAGLTGVTAITAGRHHACGLRTDGSVACWGNDDLGQFGSGIDPSLTKDTPYTQVAVTVPGVSGAVAISAMANSTYALLGDGTVVYWGFTGDDSEVADATATFPCSKCTLMPATILTGATSISAWGDNACSVMTSGAVECWGPNGVGGDGVFPSMGYGPYAVPL